MKLSADIEIAEWMLEDLRHEVFNTYAGSRAFYEHPSSVNLEKAVQVRIENEVRDIAAQAIFDKIKSKIKSSHRETAGGRNVKYVTNFYIFSEEDMETVFRKLRLANFLSQKCLPSGDNPIRQALEILINQDNPSIKVEE